MTLNYSQPTTRPGIYKKSRRENSSVRLPRRFRSRHHNPQYQHPRNTRRYTKRYISRYARRNLRKFASRYMKGPNFQRRKPMLVWFHFKTLLFIKRSYTTNRAYKIFSFFFFFCFSFPWVTLQAFGASFFFFSARH